MRQEPLHKPLKQRRAIKLAKAIKVLVLDRRYAAGREVLISVPVSTVAGPLQARPIRIQAQATLI
jgi:hypothetical protein